MEALAVCSSNAALAQESGAPVLATVFFRLDQSPKGVQERLRGFFAFAMSPMFYTCATAPRVDAAAWTTESLGAVVGSRRPRDTRGGEHAGCRRGQPPALGCARWKARAAAAGSRWPGMRELEGAGAPPLPPPRPRPARRHRQASQGRLPLHRQPFQAAAPAPAPARASAGDEERRGGGGDTAGARAGRRWPRGGGHGRRGAGMAE
ncbi:hypothetical protein U9M48_005782 [Paspalum notatum var. saurae]|uniref:Uncharacterized protein n=1 Tax=Paspalum notatum var. saurae TaxID=547442 RepID=A0AAQ3PYE2_PASNO